MKIGITERGDPSFDNSWYSKMKSVDGAIIITKNLDENLRRLILNHKDKIIVHATCTGFGNTIVEPNVPKEDIQIDNILNFIDEGFSPEQIVVRIDPIFSFLYKNNFYDSTNNITRILTRLHEEGSGIKRVRISLLDKYSHVCKRIKDSNILLYCFNEELNLDTTLIPVLEYLTKSFGYKFESCAEPIFKDSNIVSNVGCISQKDLDILGIKYSENDLISSHKQRPICNCLNCKTELLSNRKQCSHECVYCYWR